MKNISFTKNETKVILFVITVLVAGFSIKFYKQILNSPSVRFDYTSEDSLFRELSSGVNKNNMTSDGDSAISLSGSSGDKETRIETDGIININTATKSELIDLPGIGEKTAEKIISYREKNRKFKKSSDIMNVSGIGMKKYDKLKNHIKTE